MAQYRKRYDHSILSLGTCTNSGVFQLVYVFLNTSLAQSVIMLNTDCCIVKSFFIHVCLFTSIGFRQIHRYAISGTEVKQGWTCST